MEYSIQESKEGLTYQEINALAKSVGWGECYFETSEKWQHVLSASSHVAYIRINEELISFGRVLEDGVMCMFYDICVHPKFQGLGIGTNLMNCLIQKVKDKQYVSLGLFVWAGNKTADKFYSKFGFEKSTAMELKKYQKFV